MTKTIKKGLVACLIAMLAVLVGITASAWGVRAEEEVEVPDNVKAAQNFVKYMDDFKDVKLEDGDSSDNNSLWTDNEDNQRHWRNYYSAKILIYQISTIQEEELKDHKVDEEKNAQNVRDLNEALKSAREKFQEVDKIFNSAYEYVAEILSDMYDIATKPDFTEEEDLDDEENFSFGARRKRVDELGKALGLIKGEDGEGETVKKIEDKWESFIKYLTEGYERYYRADAFLDAVEKLFEDVENQIDEIYYYNRDSKQMEKRSDTEGEDEKYFIVLDSEYYMTGVGLNPAEKHGVADAETLVDNLLKEGGLTVEYEVETDGEDEKEKYTVEHVQFTREQIEKNIENYEDLTKARETIDNYKKMANEVVKKIHEVYDLVSKGSKYYTFRELIAKYKDDELVGGVLVAYNELNDYDEDSEDDYKFNPGEKHYAAMDFTGKQNFNDLQRLVDRAELKEGTLPENKTCSDSTGNHAKMKAGNKEGGALYEMLEYLDEIDEKITQVENSLKDLAAAKDTAKYNEDYKSKIDTARKAYDAEMQGDNKLDEDIIGWDLDLYYDLHPDQNTDHVADSSKYGENFPEYGVKSDEGDTRRYIVEGYGDLLEAEAKWEKWEKEIEDLIDMLQKMVDKYENKDGSYDGEGHPMIRNEYTEVKQAIGRLTDEQKAHFEKGTKLGSKEEKRITVDHDKFYLGDEEGALKEGNVNTPKEVMDEFDSIMNAIFKKVNGIIKEINDLYNNTVGKGECVFGSRKTLLDIEKKYNALDKDIQAYVYNYDLFQKMMDEYKAELELALEWKGLAEKLNYEDSNGVKVKVTNWKEIKEAVEAFAELLHETNGTAETLTQGKLGKLQTAVSQDTNEFEDEGANEDGFLTMEQVYNQKYKELAEEYAKLLEAIEALDDQMEALDTDGELDIDEFTDWIKEFEAAKKAFEDLAKNDVTGEWMSDPTNNHNEAYENYLKAEKLYKRYHVEDLINKLYQPEKFKDKKEVGEEKGYETDPEKLIKDKLVTLDKADKIHEARKAYDDYLAELGLDDESSDVRNYSKLTAAEAALESLVAELNDFMRRVANLDYEKYNLPETATYEEIVEALDEILTGGRYKGYPLDIFKKVEGKDTLPSMMEEFIELVTPVDDVLSNKEANARILYLFKARNVLIRMHKLGNKGQDNEEDNVITHLNKLITEIVEKLDKGEELDADDYDKVDEITKTYKKLHPSQQMEINKEGLKKVEEAQDTKDAIESFKNMLEELYENVVGKGEVTNYTQFYLDVLINIYDSFNPSVKESLTLAVKGAEGEAEKKLSFDEVVDAIKDAIQDAIDNDKVLSLHQMQETIEQAGLQSKEEMQQAIDALKQELAQAFMDAMLTDENSQVSLKEAIANFKNSIQQYVDSSIETAINKLAEEFQGKLDEAKKELEGNIEGLNEQLGKLEQAQENLEAALKGAIEAGDNKLLDALQAQKEDLQGNINELAAKVEAQRTALEAAKAELAEQIKQAQEEGNTALAKALETQQTALEGKIAELTATYEANKAALDAEIAALKESMLTEIEKGNDEVLKKLAAQKTDLESQLNKVKEDLQGAIDAYKDKIAALEQFKTQTEAKLADAAKASDLTALRNDLLKAMTDLDSKYVTKTEFESKLAEFQKKLDAANGSLSSIQELRDQIAGVRDEMQKGDKQLQDQIDSMSSSITTLTALLIVIGVLLIAAIVCVVILFLKRNKN